MAGEPVHLAEAPARLGAQNDPVVLPFPRRYTPAQPSPRAGVTGPGRWIVRVAILAVAIGAPVVAFATERRVSVDVEGKVRTLRTYAATGRQVLERKGVRVARVDDVAPAGAVRDGSRVVFRRAKSIRVVLDGDTQRVVAHGVTVREALKTLGLHPGPRDHVYPPLSAPLRENTELYLRNAIHAKVRVDGRLRDVVSSADTVGRLLSQAGIGLGPNDFVIPRRAVEPHEGMWVRVVRVRRFVQERSARLPYSFVRRRDPTMESGVRKVVQQGSEGLLVRRYQIVLHDGVRVGSTLLSANVLRQPRNYIVRVGTREPTFRGGGGSQSGLASWYRGDGLIAAHRSLPLGSIVRVTNVANGRTVNVKIADRGPWVDGRVIDLSDDAFGRLAPLGRGTIRVKVQS